MSALGKGLGSLIPNKKPIEGAAAVAIAGLLKSCDSFKDKNVVVLLCGGNVSSETLKMIGLL